MQCQSYFPVFYSHNDPNLDANGSARSMYNGHTSSAIGHYNNSVVTSSSRQELVSHDKELLRQTIIKHEATFQDQLQELHRLYRRQKELIDEFKKKESDEKHSHTNAFWLSSSSQSVHSQRAKHIPSLESFMYSRTPFSGPDNVNSSKMSTGSEVLHASQNVNGLSILDFSLSGGKRTRRKVLDLQLPADVYINSEDDEPLLDIEVSHVSNMAIPTLRQKSNVASLGNVKLPFSNGRLDPFYQVGSTSQPNLSSQGTKFGMFNEANLPCSSGSQCTLNGTLFESQNIKKQKLSAAVPEVATIATINGWPTSNGNSKKGTSLNSFNHVPCPQSLQRFHSEVGSVQAHDHPNPIYHHKKTGPLGSERTNLETKIIGNLSNCIINNRRPFGASSQPALQHPAFSQAFEFNYEMHSSKKKDQTFNDVPVIEVIPNFPTSTSAKMSSKGHGSDVAAHLVDSVEPRSASDEAKFFQRSYNESITKGSSGSGLSYSRDLALPMSHCTEIQTSILGSIDLNSAAVVDINMLPSPSNFASQEGEGQALPVLGVSQGSSPCNEDVTLKCKEVGSGSGSTQMIGSTDDTPNGELNGKTSKLKSFDINLPCDAMISLKGLEEDQATNLKLLANPGGKSPVPLSADRDVVEMNLEAPISPEKHEHPRPRGESEENNKVETETQVSSEEDCGQSVLEELEKVAGRSLVSISNLEDQTLLRVSKKCKKSLAYCLSWFAEVACSKGQEVEPDSVELSTSDGIDDFEAMTLKLIEAGVEDYPSCASPVQNEKETGAVSPSGGCGQQVRCSRTMKGAKRKDFQREVLPSLASLSRYEVSEDIQMIEGLMEANGTPWKMSMSMRKMGRNGRPRKGKQMCYSSPYSEENGKCLFSKTGLKYNHAVTLKDEKRTVNWEVAKRGRRGRRCRISLPCSKLSQDGWLRKWGVTGIALKGKMKKKRGLIL